MPAIQMAGILARTVDCRPVLVGRQDASVGLFDLVERVCLGFFRFDVVITRAPDTVTAVGLDTLYGQEGPDRGDAPHRQAERDGIPGNRKPR